MAKSYAELQGKQRFDDLMKFLDEEFQKLPDPRTGNATRYELADILKAAFAMFSLMNRTLPSHSTRLTPPVWPLRAAVSPLLWLPLPQSHLPGWFGV